MTHIDEKFKDCSPQSTVEKIQEILKSIGITITELWNDSGVEHCYSLSVFSNNGIPIANGKGITKEFARASAYGEFIERLQGGLFLYKYQSICRQPDMNLHAFAPDAKYMSAQELLENGQWMDYIIDAYQNRLLSRESIVEHCKAYACANDDKILTLPFYSLFEDKYVYLPMGFVDHMYSTNGCCVGNTREEAWVHAFSEMMERHANLKMLLTGNSAPKIPEETLQQFPTVSKILSQLRKTGEFDVDIFDYSIGNGFPVVSTRIISKKTHSYRVNVAADPVLEIAIQRTLTELFQGKNLINVTKKHNGRILNCVSDIPAVNNVINQLETSSGLYTADFFANEITCTRKAADFPDNSSKNNKELLLYMLDLYRQLNKPVYVRNFSYLGFPCYRFVVPGFSEALSVRLDELIPEYAISDEASKTLRQPENASDEDLDWMLAYSNVIRGVMGRYNHFARISGIPISDSSIAKQAAITRAFAAYRINRLHDAIEYTAEAMESSNQDELRYFSCVLRFLQLKESRIADDKIFSILDKFYESDCTTQLRNALKHGGTPYSEFLLSCDYKNCTNCKSRDICSYQMLRTMNQKVGQIYSTFTCGQDRSEFAI